MAKPESFKETCEAMGGEYTEEFGMLESDVGGDHLAEYEARKQWCDFGKLEHAPKAGLTIFRSPRHVELQSELFEPTARPKFDEFFNEVLNPKQQQMCFKSTLPTFSDQVEGIAHFCIITYPKGDPKSVWLGFPDWGYAVKRK